MHRQISSVIEQGTLDFFGKNAGAANRADGTDLLCIATGRDPDQFDGVTVTGQLRGDPFGLPTSQALERVPMRIGRP